MRTDLGIDVSKRSELFLAEVSGLIESGEVTDDDKDVIEDVQDAWGIESDGECVGRCARACVGGWVGVCLGQVGR